VLKRWAIGAIDRIKNELQLLTILHSIYIVSKYYCNNMKTLYKCAALLLAATIHTGHAVEVGDEVCIYITVIILLCISYVFINHLIIYYMHISYMSQYYTD